jgi:hypothetical protein
MLKPEISRALLIEDFQTQIRWLSELVPDLDEHDLEVLAARLNDVRFEFVQALREKSPPAQVIGFKDFA